MPYAVEATMSRRAGPPGFRFRPSGTGWPVVNVSNRGSILTFLRRLRRPRQRLNFELCDCGIRQCQTTGGRPRISWSDGIPSGGTIGSNRNRQRSISQSSCSGPRSAPCGFGTPDRQFPESQPLSMQSTGEGRTRFRHRQGNGVNPMLKPLIRVSRPARMIRSVGEGLAEGVAAEGAIVSSSPSVSALKPASINDYCHLTVGSPRGPNRRLDDPPLHLLAWYVIESRDI